MSTLYLVRHGQASFGKEDYDQLSELGYQQAQVAGEYLSKITKPIIFVSGSLKRQRQTLSEIKKGFSDADIKRAKSLELSEFNEFNHKDILNVVYPNFRELHSEMLSSLLTCPEAFKKFQVMYKSALLKWIENDGNFNESFDEFTQRIKLGIDKLMSLVSSNDNSSESLDESIVLVSSAGPISSCMQYGVDLSPKSAFLLCEEMVNTAISSLKFNDKGEATLSYFNNFQHLIFSDSTVTYR